jgi:hypothetical protein
MTKREQLRRLRRITAGEKRQPPEHPNHDQIQQSNRHWPRSCPTRTSHETAAQGHCAGSGTVQGSVRPASPRVSAALQALLDQVNTDPPRMPGDPRPITYTIAA